MAEWEKRIGGMNLVVGDLARSTAFYREVLGQSPLHEEDGLAVYRFPGLHVALREDPSHEGPAVDVLRQARLGVGQFAIGVDDVDAVAAELRDRGVTPIDGPADRPWGIRTVTFADPGGYVWEIAQDLDEPPGAADVTT